MPTLTDAQMAARQSGLGGTDIAAIAGVSRWSRPITVFYEKRPDMAPPRAERTTTPMMAMGHLLEPVIADLFVEATGIRLRRRTGTVNCREHPWEFGHVDRMVHGDPGIIFEAKWAMSSDGWGPSATLVTPDSPRDIIPVGYMAQVQWYLHVLGARAVYVGALLGYADFRWYQIERDQEMIDGLVALGESFWHDHVLAGVPPDPDGSAEYGQMLRRLHPRDDGTTIVATPELATALRDLRDIEARLGSYQQQADAVRQRIQRAMGDATALIADGVKVTWRQNKPTTKTDWQAVAAAYDRIIDRVHEWLGGNPEATEADVRQMLKQWSEGAIESIHTNTTEGARPFRVTYTDKEQD